jgi:muramoyltetrapeptide carboxypeptidase
VERNINARTMYYVPKTKVKAIEPKLQTGDIIGITTTIKGIDCSHTGLCYRDENGLLRFLHASLTKKQVMLDDELSVYLASVAKHTGIIVVRPVFSTGPAGTLEDPIIDSEMTEQEAFAGLDPSCPKEVRARQRLVEVRYFGFDGKIHRGQLVIDGELATEVREIFEVMLTLKFPIGSVIPVSLPKFRKEGRWDDELSMAANNTSAFNYRRIEGTNKLSYHAHGRAIDINPVQNPYVRGTVVIPAGARYDVAMKGTLSPKHLVVKTFLERGWKWGGSWRSMKDYQHFDKPFVSEGPRPPTQTGAVDRRAWITPPALRRGDTIMLVAPASPVDKDVVLRYAKQLEAAGFRVMVPESLNRVDRYLAGSDAQRSAELNTALRDPKVNAIFPCRGGFGLTRILDRLDYEALRARPKVVTGFSDLTALHLAIARKARVVTFHAPMPEFDLWRHDGEFAFAAAAFRRVVFADGYQVGEQGFLLTLSADGPRPIKLVGGRVKGRLVGGNLTLICTTLGTPYAIEPEGNILMIEDTGERPYQIDRALSQLRLAGVLDAFAGVVVGQFAKTDEKEVERILRDYIGGRKVPAIRNFPFGHTPYNATLPHGGLVELDADAPSLRLLENPVTLK